MSTPRRRRTGLLSEPGRGFCQDLALFTEDPVLAAQAVEFLALAGAQAIAAQTFIQCGLLDPLADRIGGWFELARQLLDLSLGPRQFDDAPPVFQRVLRMGWSHWGISFFPSPQHRLRNRVNSRIAERNPQFILKPRLWLSMGLDLYLLIFPCAFR